MINDVKLARTHFLYILETTITFYVIAVTRSNMQLFFGQVFLRSQGALFQMVYAKILKLICEFGFSSMG